MKKDEYEARTERADSPIAMPEMGSCIDFLEKRASALRSLLDVLLRNLEKAPEGTINLSISHGSTEFHLYQNGKRRHLKASEQPLVRKILQKTYDQKLFQIAEKELLKTEAFLKDVRSLTGESLFLQLADTKQKLVLPRIETRDLFVKAWEEKAAALYAENRNSYEISDEFVTSRGECVRSKSELIIAEELDRAGVPYFYELPLILPDGTRFFPDFTVLNVEQRKVYYWEHFGMTSEADYFAKMAKKLRTLERAGIFPGKGLILTTESAEVPLSTGSVRAMIREWLL